MAPQIQRPVGPPAPRPVLEHHRQWLSKLALWSRGSIRARLQFSHLLTSLLPLLALGTALLYTSAQAERRIVEQTQKSVAASISLDVAELLGQAESDLLGFGRRVRLTSTDRNAVQADANEFVSRHFPDIIDLAILDEQGNEVVRVTQDRVYPATELINRVNEPFFTTTSEGLIHRSVVQTADGRRVLQFAVPARNSIGQVIGSVVAQIATNDIEQRLAAVPPDAGRSTFIIDEEGNVLLGQPPATLIGTNDLHNWALSDQLIATLRGADGSAVAAARAPVQPTSWSIVVEQPTDFAFYSLRRNTWLLALMVLITAGIVVVWGLIVAREMTRPILQLRDGVHSLKSGQLGDTIDVARDDELGQLAAEFNSMSQRLAESQQEIEQRNARLREGLDLARVIQRDLLPHGPPSTDTLFAHAVCEPAAEIGGDFYSYVPLADGRTRLIIGDASGKGVAAALVMALTSSLVEVHARHATNPAKLLTRLNTELFPRFTSNHQCVALQVADFDPSTRQICVASAGMISPLITGSNACYHVPCFGPPLGIVDGVVYTETTVELLPDQAAVFISDGIVEARNPANEMWGFGNLERTVCTASDGGAEYIVKQVLSAIKLHAMDTPPADDMTIIAATLTPTTEDFKDYAFIPSAADLLPHGQPAPGQL